MRKLVLFGDSLLKNLNKDLIIKLESKLQIYDVYNFAVGGWDTNDGASKSSYISSLKPDVVVVGFGTNDAAPWKEVPLDQFEKNINIILDNFRDSRIIYFLPPPVNEDKQEDNLKRSNITVKKYHDSAKSVCLGSQADILESWKIFMPMLERGQDYHIEDGVHLNDLGYKVLIDNMVKNING